MPLRNLFQQEAERRQDDMDLVINLLLTMLSVSFSCSLVVLKNHVYPYIAFPTNDYEKSMKGTSSVLKSRGRLWLRKSGNCLSLRNHVPDVFHWPKIYFMFFFLFPIAVFLTVLLLLTQEKYAALNTDIVSLSTKQGDRRLSTNASAFYFVSIYFFVIMPMTKLLAVSETIVSHYHCHSLYEWLPISFHKRLHLQCGIGGVFCLCISFIFGIASASVSWDDLLMNENETETEVEFEFDCQENCFAAHSIPDEFFTLLIVFPLLSLVKFGYKGFRSLLWCCTLDVIPGVNYLWSLKHAILGIFVLTKLAELNAFAGNVLLASWIAFYLLPTALWLSFSSIVQVEELTTLDWQLKGCNRTLCRSSVRLQGFSLTSKHYSDKADIGLSAHVLWHSFSDPLNSVTIHQPSTELSASLKVIRLQAYFYTDYEVNRLCYKEGQSMDYRLRYLYATLCCSCLCLTYSTLYFASFRRLCEREEQKKLILLSPWNGRSLFPMYSTCDFDVLIFAVDSPGFDASISYFHHLSKTRTDNESFAFFWECSSMSDFVKLRTCFDNGFSNFGKSVIFFKKQKLSYNIYRNLKTLRSKDILLYDVSHTQLCIDFLNKYLSDTSGRQYDNGVSMGLMSLGSSSLAYRMKNFTLEVNQTDDVAHISCFEAVKEASYHTEPQLKFEEDD